MTVAYWIGALGVSAVVVVYALAVVFAKRRETRALRRAAFTSDRNPRED